MIARLASIGANPTGPSREPRIGFVRVAALALLALLAFIMALALADSGDGSEPFGAVPAADERARGGERPELGTAAPLPDLRRPPAAPASRGAGASDSDASAGESTGSGSGSGSGSGGSAPSGGSFSPSPAPAPAPAPRSAPQGGGGGGGSPGQSFDDSG